ncbi:MAG: hypothetical protein ACI9XO_002652, partial [Paraglaciecola sp.]
TLYNQHFPFLKILSQKQAFYRHLFQKIYKLSKTVIFINSQKLRAEKSNFQPLNL